MVGVELLWSGVSDRVRAPSREELPVILIRSMLTSIAASGTSACLSVGRIARANAFEDMFRVMTDDG